MSANLFEKVALFFVVVFTVLLSACGSEDKPVPAVVVVVEGQDQDDVGVPPQENDTGGDQVDVASSLSVMVQTATGTEGTEAQPIPTWDIRATVAADSGALPASITGRLHSSERVAGVLVPGDKVYGEFVQTADDTWELKLTMTDIHAASPIDPQTESSRMLVAEFSAPTGESATEFVTVSLGCTSTSTFCSDRCSNTYIDAQNCGVCGRVCDSGTACQQATCRGGSAGLSGCIRPTQFADCNAYCASLGRSCSPFCRTSRMGHDITNIGVQSYFNSTCTSSPLYGAVRGSGACSTPLASYPPCGDRCREYALLERTECRAAGGSNCESRYTEQVSECDANCAATSTPTHFNCCCQ